ncbi:MAG: Octanoate-[acyl-carrier-protein]-protein-N-octanoyltransferase [uncultured Segetibacter sp.]|uniref:Octanoate-[acyl-carrier-protein]-protein-N-octano yltransferase n=1 Tax=uncultured Segetibacter sp. TaxID=481133 RepID=A0A6J4RDQ0_9BACT|nr:MAG: Octanoate-[acyl-carrier-protein]-protein-N-octanoyltransferase [uncultured Segetibacter sp.]
MVLPGKLILAQDVDSDTTVQSELDIKYDSVLARATSSLTASDYQQSINYYKEASVLKPGESYPYKMIKYVQDIAAKQKRADDLKRKAQIKDDLVKANQAIVEKNWDSAKVLFNEILTLHPEKADEDYARSKVEAIDLELERIALRTPVKEAPPVVIPPKNRREARARRKVAERNASLAAASVKGITDQPIKAAPLPEKKVLTTPPPAKVTAQKTAGATAPLPERKVAAAPPAQELPQKTAGATAPLPERKVAAAAPPAQELPHKTAGATAPLPERKVAAAAPPAQELPQKTAGATAPLPERKVAAAAPPAQELPHKTAGATAPLPERKVAAVPPAQELPQKTAGATAPLPERKVAAVPPAQELPQKSAGVTAPLPEKKVVITPPPAQVTAQKPAEAPLPERKVAIASPPTKVTQKPAEAPLPEKKAATATPPSTRERQEKPAETPFTERTPDIVTPPTEKVPAGTASLSFSDSSNYVKLICQDISFIGTNAYIKVLIQNYSPSASFLTDTLQVSIKQKNGIIKNLGQRFFSNFPVVLPQKELVLVYFADASIAVEPDDIFILQMQDKLKQTKLVVQVPWSLYKQQKGF